MAERNDLDFFDDDAAAQSTTGSNSLMPITAQYLVFSVAKLELAIGLSHVSEITPYERVSLLPGTASYVRGVTQVRGRWTPVVDLARKFGLAPEPITKRSCILILELQINGELSPVGVVLDGVATLLDLDISHISPPPRLGLAVDAAYVTGIVATERGSLPVVDFARVFEPAELAQLASGAETAARQSSLTP